MVEVEKIKNKIISVYSQGKGRFYPTEEIAMSKNPWYTKGNGVGFYFKTFDFNGKTYYKYLNRNVFD